MTFLATTVSRVPQDGSGNAYALTRLVKIFSNNDMVALETSINTFLAGLKTSPVQAIVFDISYLGTQGTASRVIVTYGLFNPAT